MKSVAQVSNPRHSEDDWNKLIAINGEVDTNDKILYDGIKQQMSLEIRFYAFQHSKQALLASVGSFHRTYEGRGFDSGPPFVLVSSFVPIHNRPSRTSQENIRMLL